MTTKPDDARQAATGADKPTESDDPMILAGTYVPGGLSAMSEAAVLEFSQIGMSSEKIFQLFESPFFTGTHRYYRLQGASKTRAMISRVLEHTPPIQYRIEVPERNCYQTEEEMTHV